MWVLSWAWCHSFIVGRGSWDVPAFWQFCALVLVVVTQLVCGPMCFLLGPGGLNHPPLGALNCLDELLDFLECEAVLEVVVGGVFLHDVLGYRRVFQSLDQGVHYHLVCLGGLSHR